MTKVKVFDNFGKEIRDNSLICIIGEKIVLALLR